MPGKLINTLKYGSGRTKRKIYLMLGILAAGAVLTMVAIILGNAMLGLAAFLVIFIDGLILFNTSFEQKTVSVKQEEQKKEKRAKKEKKAKKKTEDEDVPGALEWVASEKKEKKKENSEEEEAVKEEEPAEEKEINPLVQYDEGKLKKIMVAYKVKKHHVPVMIDMCSAEKIVQSPAYLWNDANYLYFLVLEKEPRLIKSRLSESDTIHIRRGMSARPMEEYSDLNEPSVVSMIFGSLLPKYYKKESGSYRLDYRKNLYSAAPGIWCTSASVKNMLKLLPERFALDDGKIEDESIYYQEIYIARILFWDGVYSGEEYKAKVLEVLNNLAKSELSNSIVQEYLTIMMLKGLIPQEYADYVLTKRKGK